MLPEQVWDGQPARERGGRQGHPLGDAAGVDARASSCAWRGRSTRASRSSARRSSPAATPAELTPDREPVCEARRECFARLISDAYHCADQRAGDPAAARRSRGRARRLRQEAGTGLSPSLNAALATIERHGPLTPSELPTRERVQRPTVTRIAGRLEESGLVTRAADPADGRSSLISVTPAGGALLEAGARARTPSSPSASTRSRPEDRATLERAAALLEGMLE